MSLLVICCCGKRGRPFKKIENLAKFGPTDWLLLRADTPPLPSLKPPLDSKRSYRNKSSTSDLSEGRQPPWADL